MRSLLAYKEGEAPVWPTRASRWYAVKPGRQAYALVLSWGEDDVRPSVSPKGLRYASLGEKRSRHSSCLGRLEEKVGPELTGERKGGVSHALPFRTRPGPAWFLPEHCRFYPSSAHRGSASLAAKDSCIRLSFDALVWKYTMS